MKIEKYCNNPYKRERYKTIEVTIGNLKMGGDNPIRIQSMTTADTMATQKSVEEAIRMIDAGCELVRLTAPSKKEAENLGIIKQELVKRGYNTPLVADIHFTPNAAEVAAKLIEKVRVNPGNYADKKKFEEIEYTDEAYEQELLRIEEKFTPLVLLCKEQNTAMRIGTNHGSLSDRILSRYGDTPQGMVESAMEFLRICRKNDFHSIVISMKASNTIVMVQAYRLLMAEMIKSNMKYPLHLGVTEAGDGEDGRIKSAVGIGALLEDGIGDTIRVSLTENPEHEMPVAQKLVNQYIKAKSNLEIDANSLEICFKPFEYERRESNEIENVGGKHVPIVITDLSEKDSITETNLFGVGHIYSKTLDKWNRNDHASDYIYIGKNKINFELPGFLNVISDYENWNRYNKQEFPLVDLSELKLIEKNQTCFVKVSAENINLKELKNYPKAVIVLDSNYDNKTQVYRYFFFNLYKEGIENPVVLFYNNEETDTEQWQLEVATKSGVMFIDGMGDGLWLKGNQPLQIINATAFGILQATRTRISKTEYISCPSCGRTLFDLQETTQKIREKTAHLKGIKIGIMGCIVNGPGEMADADYGYVGTGPGKITLYKEKTVVRKNVAETNAVNELIELIKEHGDWVEPVATS